MRNRLILLAAGASALGVGGCGHGSSHSAAAPGGGLPIASGLQAAGTTTAPPFSSASAPASFATTGGFVTGGAAPATADTPGAATVTLTTDANGNLTQMVINAPTGGGNTFQQTFSASQLQSVSNPVTLSALVAAVQHVQTLSVNQATAIFQGLSFSAYGAWLQSNGAGKFAIGMLGFGSETTTAQMQALTGQVMYNGSTFGVGATGNTPFGFTGTVLRVATFPSGTVATTFSNLATQTIGGNGPSVTLPNISGSGTIGVGVNPNQYAFTLAGAGGYTGNMTGTFYGATAQETVGAWQARNNGAPGTTLAGSFGAHK